LTIYRKLKFTNKDVESIRTGKFAVVDLGSNSLRLSIFNDIEKYPHPFISERYRASLAEDKVSDDFTLSEEKIEEVLKALKWFNWVCKEQCVENAVVVATSAIREAKNGADLVSRALVELGVDINVIDGLTEAKLSAIGALHSIRNANGLVLDLGGGSLEVYDTNSDNQLSLPLGILTLKAMTNDNPHEAVKILTQELSKYDWLKNTKGTDLIANGGGMRAIAMLHIKKTGYPIAVPQGYSINYNKNKTFFNDLFNVDIVGNYFTGYDVKFKSALPYRAALLKALFEINPNFQNLKFSNFGLREGVLLSQLENIDYNLTQKYAKDIAVEKGFGLAYALSSYSFISEVLHNVEHDLLYLTSLLKDIAWKVHKQYRAESLFTEVLNLDFVGVNHTLRTKLALACYFTQESTTTKTQDDIINKILTTDEILQCKLVGQFYKLTDLINPSRSGDFSSSNISIKDGLYHFQTSDEIQEIISLGLEKRLKELNNILNQINKQG
jgi:exopolyphosphatase / guanosine-5'-triphosphate,3'-diphosphate pyrophosphatase